MQNHAYVQNSVCVAIREWPLALYGGSHEIRTIVEVSKHIYTHAVSSGVYDSHKLMYHFEHTHIYMFQFPNT